MTSAQRYELEQVALALAAYNKAASEKPELKAILDRVPVPGGYDIEHFYMTAVKLSNAYPRMTDAEREAEFFGGLSS